MSPIDAMADVAGLAFSFAIFGNLAYYGVLITMYVLHSLGLYTIAKRRELKNPWMAWVPGLQLWILGSIADQYMYVAKDKVRNRRKWLIGLAIAMAVIVIVFYIMFFAAYFNIIFDVIESAEMGMDLSDEYQVLQNVLALLAPSLVALLLMLGVSIALAVVEYICYYKLFASCDPENKTLFLVLGIFFSFLMPIFVFVCRKKDMGMPPRKDAQPAYISQPVYMPQQPYQQPYQQPVPPAQPWAQPAAPAQPVQPTEPAPPAENEQ